MPSGRGRTGRVYTSAPHRLGGPLPVTQSGTPQPHCPRCQAQVAPGAGRCGRCAELVVHPGGVRGDDAAMYNDSGPSQSAVVRTVYLQTAASHEQPASFASHAMGLTATFLMTFSITTIGVLAVWTVVSGARPPVPIQEPRIEVVERVVPVPVPVPVPTPRPVAARPRPAPVAPPVVAAPVAPVPVPAPIVVSVRRPPPPPPPVPAAAAALSGSYSGRVDGRSATLDLDFRGEGVVAGTLRYSGGSVSRASGEYQLSGDTATVMLMEETPGDPLVYTGEVSATKGTGRITSGGRNIGRFSLTRPSP